jgi:dethiobiotin synthetase
MKPVAAGGEPRDGRIFNADVAQLMGTSTVSAPVELVNPYVFSQPLAPHIGAELAGLSIDLERIRLAYDELARRADWVIVEGAGGFRVPLGPHIDTADLARTLALPVIVVVGMRLGCLNHALLTVESVRATGLALAGWVANHIDPDMMFGAENVKALEARVDAPLVARIPYTPHSSAAQIARHFDITSLDERTT